MIWILPLLGCLAGVVFLLNAIFGGGSAIQQAASAAVGCTCAVIPYVFARAVEKSGFAGSNVSVQFSDSAKRQIKRLILAAVVMFVVIFAITTLADFIPTPRFLSGPSGPAVEKACAEFRPKYDNMVNPTEKDIRFAQNCRKQGYWK